MSDLTTPATVNEILTFLKDSDRDALIAIGATFAQVGITEYPPTMWGTYHRALDEARLIIGDKGLPVEDQPHLWEAIRDLIEAAVVKSDPTETA